MREYIKPVCKVVEVDASLLCLSGDASPETETEEETVTFTWGVSVNPAWDDTMILE